MLALMTGFGANAQFAPAQIQKVRLQENNIAALEQQPVSAPSVAATGDTITGLYYDFSTPANWTFGNENGTTGSWVVGTAVPAGPFPIDGILSTTAANGFALYDSDLICPTSDNAFIQLANPVDLTSQSSVAVRFQENYRKLNDQTFLEVSIDGTSWTTYEVNSTVAGNASTDNPENVEVNISGVAANQAQVWIRFRFQGACDYAWMIDDVAFVEGAASDLAMNDVWHGDIINAFEYQQIPLAQTTEVIIGATCENAGSDTQTNAVYTFDISDGSSSVASGTFPANNASIASTASDTTWFATGFTPSATGDYTVTVSVAADQTDEFPSNNELTSNFKMTEDMFAHDDIDNVEFIITGTDADGNTPEFKMALYYEMTAAANLTAVQVAFGRLTTTTSCIVEVFDAVNDQSLSNPLVTEVYDILPGDIATGNGVTILTDILINDGDGVQLDAGGVYLISIGNSGANEELFLEASDGDADRAQLRYGPFGVGGSIDWYTGYTTSPILRGNFDPTVGIEENEDVAGVSIYPNPAKENVTVKFTSKEDQDITVNVISLTGALIQSEQLTTKAGQSDRVTFDTESLSAGVYMVQLVGVNSSLTERIVVR